MKYVYSTLCVALMMLYGCNSASEQKKFQQKIADEETALTMIDIASEDDRAQGLVELYLEYADKYPSDSANVSMYLMRAADVSGNLGEVDDAIVYLDRIIEDYSDVCEDLGMCYFLKGHFYELGERYDDAQVAYNAYLELFPDHYLAEGVKKMLPYIGRPAEELFEMIMSTANDSNIANNLVRGKEK